MNQSTFQEKFNNSIVTALLYHDLSLCEKERKLQQYVNECEERYDLFCDNINKLLENKDTSTKANTLYLTIEGYSFISDAILDFQESCFPVLTINKYSPQCADISMYLDLALYYFCTHCEFSKEMTKVVEQSG